ncbi:MAG: tetratricopeptide repeat protein, partial [Verrucomicrobiota bacterium]
AWVPPVLAALVCGLELTFWEHATAATNEALDLLVFAYVIRCLLEYRIDQRESWLTRMSFVYGLGVTNSFAMIGFFPCVLVAVLWIRGLRFFEFGFMARMFLSGLLGLSLYLVLPLVWVMSDNPTVSFWQTLRSNLVTQKMALWDMPGLRSRALILCVTSLVPAAIIGIRWPSTFGDTSVAGAFLANIMFRVVHVVFLVACLAITLDLQFSPRSIGARLPYAPPFLSFYYLAALSVGYFSGYLLLVFGEARAKQRHRRSGGQLLLNRVVVAAVWLALLGMPVALLIRNWQSVRTTNGRVLLDFAELSTKALPAKGSIVLSDDPYSLLMLSARLSNEGAFGRHVLVHTRSLLGSDYHRELSKRYPGRWPNYFTNQPPDEVIDDGNLLRLITYLSRTNELYYLHPSFGYYFEQFYLQPHGLVYQLQPYATNAVFPPPLSKLTLEENRDFWDKLDGPVRALAAGVRTDSRDAHYVSRYYSRALNYWGVALQRDRELERGTRLEQAGKCFQLAAELNTNNIPAESNLQFNRSLRTGQPRPLETAKSIEDKFGAYRGWEPMLVENGPFDHPDFCLQLGQIFAGQSLFREAVIQLDRAHQLEGTNVLAQLTLAEVYNRAQLPNQALAEIGRIKAQQTSAPLTAEVELQVARIEATAQFALQKPQEAERVLKEAFAKYPKYPGVLDTLLQIYAQTGRLEEALATSETMIAADPDRAQSYINQSTLYRRMKDSTNALAAVERILKKSPQQPEALLYKVFLLIQAKDFAQAKTAIDGLLAVDSENINALLYKGVIDLETKAYAEAVEPLSAVLKRQPNNATALRDRALAYLQLGQMSKAEKDYNTMRRLITRDFVYVAYYGLGEIAYKRNDYDTARKYYDLYLKNAPTDEDAELAAEKKLVTTRLQSMPDKR